MSFSMRKLLTFIFLTIAIASIAENRTDQEMRTIAASHFGSSNQAFNQQRKPIQSLLYTPMVDDTYTVFSPQDGKGFVVIARNTKYPAVLAYSDAEFKADSIPADVQWWFHSVKKLMATGKSVKHKATFKPVDNFITTLWGQGAPFNRKTPNQMPSGCVATALAQAMNYWKYPASAQFEENYYVMTDSMRRYTAEVNSTYTWNFKDNYSASGPRQGNDVAQFLADCGYATCMQYANSGSGTYTFMAARALTYYFGYPKASVKTWTRGYVSDERFYQTIYNELMAKMPIVFGGSDANFGGHAFVLSGIDDEGLVWVNWGWDGKYNGFYAIDLMDSPEGYFKDSQAYIYGIRPTVSASDHIEGRIRMNGKEPYTFKYEPFVDEVHGIDVQQCIQVNIPNGFFNENGTDMCGSIGLFATDLTDGSQWIVAEPDRDTIYCATGYFGDGLMFYYDVADLRTGHTYRMSFGVHDDQDTQWRSLYCQGGEIAYDVTINGDGTASISEPVKMDSADAIHGIIADKRTKAADSLARVYDASGRLVYSAPTSSFNLWDIPARGVLVVKQGEKAYKIVR